METDIDLEKDRDLNIDMDFGMDTDMDMNMKKSRKSGSYWPGYSAEVAQIGLKMFSLAYFML
jgi:hypothetical protein